MLDCSVSGKAIINHGHYYISSGLTVIFQGVGYEYGVEMTYPVPESISAGIMNAFSQV